MNSFGGGIYIIDWDDLSTASTVVYDSTPNPLIYNNLICDNYSESYGGGVSIWRADWYILTPSPGENIVPQPVFINNTISNNRSNKGWGIFIMNYYPLFINNIIWNKPTLDIGSEIYLGDVGYSWSNVYGDIEILNSNIQSGWIGQGNLDSNPSFLDSINYYLSNESSCIDAGHDSSLFDDIEQGGVAVWPAMGTLRNDMGAYGGPYEYSHEEMIGLIDYITDIKKNMGMIPYKVKLFQNYPNPFNPKTINYQLPITNFVDLSINNLLGQKVATLVSENKVAGFHQVEWDATNFSSGVYYYRLTAGDFIETKKLVAAEVNNISTDDRRLNGFAWKKIE